MEGSRLLLAALIAFTTTAFSAFGTFFLDIAPPGVMEGYFANFFLFTAFAVVIAGVYAITSVETRRQGHPNYERWNRSGQIFFGCFIVLFMTYYFLLTAGTVDDTNGESQSRVVVGFELTDFGNNFFNKEPPLTRKDAFDSTQGLNREELIWTRESIYRNRLYIMTTYVLLCLAFATSLICFLNGTPRGAKPGEEAAD